MRNHVFSALLFASPVLALGQFNYDAKILDYKGLKFPCEGSVVPKLLIRNDGTVAMSGCVVETWKNGVLVNSFDWQLAIPSVPGESRQPVFPVVPDVEPNDELEFKIKTVNTVPDQNADGNEKVVLLDDPFAATSAAVIEVKIATDGAPGELTWEIRDAGGTLIASGGPYEDANTLISEFVALGSSACYEFKGQDSGRDILSGAGMQVVASGTHFSVTTVRNSLPELRKASARAMVPHAPMRWSLPCARMANHRRPLGALCALPMVRRFAPDPVR